MSESGLENGALRSWGSLRDAPSNCARRREPIGAGRQANGFAELAGERRLIRVAAFERQLAQRRIGAPEPLTGPVDAQPRQILAGRKAEQRPDSLIEPESGKAGSRGQIRNA